MPNPLLNAMASNQPQNNMMGMLQQFNQFKQQMAGKNPQAMVQQLIQSGQMSRQQFDQFSQMANQMVQFLK